MPDDELLDELEDRWLTAAEAGRRLTPTDLCPDRPDLAPVLASRLAVHARFYALAALPNGDDRTATAGEPAIGYRLGQPPDTVRYRFLGFVARGGMGEVWRAFDGELKREVAVKVLKPRVGVPAERFRAEAELVARLEHPGIVPVYDAGVLADGRAFFAMKLIRAAGDGPTPTLDELLIRRTDPPEDLPRFVQVFQQACEAVAYAHALTPPVLHRDLKPSNIMVGAFGEVLVMDWGLGKVLGTHGQNPTGPASAADTGRPIDTAGDALPPEPQAQDTGERSDTRTGDAKGTPAYMPPEQACGDWAVVGPAADVFALGGVLCTILTGLPPYLGRSLDVFTRARAGDLADAHDRLAHCGADPELIAIARTCLTADADARYADAGALARAVAAYRAGLEARLRAAELDRVRAAGDRDRAELAVREERKRRRLQLRLGGVALTILAAGVGVSMWQAKRAKRAEADTAAQLELTRAAEQTALDEKNRAVQQERIAVRVRQAFEEVLGQSDVYGQLRTGQVPNPNLTVKEAVDNTIRRLDGRLSDEPLTEAEIRFTLGVVSYNLGNFLQSETQLRRAADLFDRAVGSTHERTLDCRLHLGTTLLTRLKTVTAAEVFEDVARTAEPVYGPEHPVTFTARFQAGRSLGRAPATRPRGDALMTDTLAAARRARGSTDVAVARMAATLGREYAMRREYARAEPLLTEAMAVERTILGDTHPETLITVTALGDVSVELGRTEVGERLLREAIDGQTAQWGEDHPMVLQPLFVLANAYNRSRRPADAAALLGRIAAIQKKVRGPSDPATMQALLSLAQAKMGLKEYAEAAATYREVIEVLKESGHRDVSYYELFVFLGDALFHQKKYKEAEEALVTGCKALVRLREEDPAADLTNEELCAWLDKLIRLYETTGKPDAVKTWKAERARFEGSAGKGK
jgi:eukaryotic-like serine/threonine-protein kinase